MFEPIGYTVPEIPVRNSDAAPVTAFEPTPTVDLPAVQPSANLPPHMVMLVESGNTQMRLRDIAAARLYFEAAVEAGATRGKEHTLAGRILRIQGAPAVP